jgi:hypothetical protein
VWNGVCTGSLTGKREEYALIFCYCFSAQQWQADAVYVNHILNDADQLVSRAMEAIFEEYGHPKPSTAEGLAERMKMFHWDKIDLSTATEPPEPFRGKVLRGNGGWTTKRSFEG